MTNPKVSLVAKDTSEKRVTQLSRTIDFTMGWPARTMHLKQRVLAKAMEVYLHEENEEEYHNSLDYGLNEGPWSMRCILAEWLNGICNAANYGEEKKSNSNEKKEKEKEREREKDKTKPRVLTSIPRLTDDVSTDPSAIGYRGVHLFLTAGVSDGLRLCCSALMHPRKERDIVLCEDPTYFITPNIIRSYHGQILPIETSPKHGLNISYLRKVLQNCAKHDMLKRIAFFYVIPFFHNPLGVSLTLEKCQQLVQLAHEYDIWIVSDEIYMNLAFPRDSHETNHNSNDGDNNEKNDDRDNDSSNTMYGRTYSLSIIEKLMYPDLDNDKYRVLSLSAMSKIIGPGLRCGWIHTFNEHYLDHMLGSDGVLISSGCLSTFAFSLLQHVWLSDEWSLHLRYVQKQLARNCKLLCAELFKYNTPKLTLLKCYCVPSGGYFLWVELPQGITCDQLESFIQQKHALVKVAFSHGCSSSCFSPLASQILFQNDLIWDWTKYQNVHHPQMKRCVRLCFAYLNENDLREGAKVFTDSVFALYQENLKLLDVDKKNGGGSSFH